MDYPVVNEYIPPDSYKVAEEYTLEEYIAALRSGNYSQSRKCLNVVEARLRYQTASGKDIPVGMCCLGVYIAQVTNFQDNPPMWTALQNTTTAVYSPWAHSYTALESPESRRLFGKMIGLNTAIPIERDILLDVTGDLMVKNDTGHSFSQIADWLENDLKVFIEQKRLHHSSFTSYPAEQN